MAHASSVVPLHPDDPAADRTGTPPLPPRDDGAPESAVPPGERRPAPLYDGREPARAKAGDVLVWIPRVLFFPIHATLEYGVRWPIIRGLTWAEDRKVFARIADVFSFRGGRSALYPTAYVDFGVSPSVGFFAPNHDLFVKGHDFTLQGGFWDDDYVRVRASDRWQVLDGSGDFTVRAEFSSRPDEVYYGVGYDTEARVESPLSIRRFDAEIELASFLSGLNRLGVMARWRTGRYDFTAPIAAAPILPDAGTPFSLVGATVVGVLDTRSEDREFSGGSGLRLGADAGFHVDPTAVDARFFRFGVDSTAFVDLSGRNHVLALRVTADLIESRGVVPVTDLLFLGGDERLRGFLPGRFRGQSAFTVGLSYRYPMWMLADAILFLETGNVFDARFVDFAWDRLVLSGGFGVKAGLSRESSIDLLVAFGSRRFEVRDFELFDTVRLVFGVTHAF